MFNKLAIAAAALAVAIPAQAGSIHDFTPGRDYGTPTAPSRASLDGECYDTEGGHRVCFQRVQNEVFTLSVLDMTESLYPHTFLIDCDGQWKGYGPFDQATSQKWVDAFCDNGRY